MNSQLSFLSKGLERAGRVMASPTMAFLALPWLLALLVAGTWAQRSMGLHEAQKHLLSSFVVWVGFLPLPGMATTVLILLLSIVVKFVFFSPFRWDKSGIILSHLGVLILLLGGAITFFSQEEWLIRIQEGEESQVLSDYHERALKIYRDDYLIVQIPFNEIVVGTPLVFPEAENLDFLMIPRFLCANCKGKEAEFSEKKRFGILEKISLDSNQKAKEDSENIAGLEIEIKGLDENQDGLYATLEDVPMKPNFETKSGRIELQMSRLEMRLPFSVYLEDFRKEDYPGTSMAKAYSSSIVIKDNGIEYPAFIEMNKPLRYRGYTFYQSSFVQGEGKDQTILNVVRNTGALFPYIASVVIFIGLLLHLLIILKNSMEKNEHE